MNTKYHPLTPNRRIHGNLKGYGSIPKIHREGLLGENVAIPTQPSVQFSAVGKLENAVTRLQIAKSGIGKIKEILKEMKMFLEEEVAYTPKPNIPGSVINHFLKERIVKIKMISEGATFGGKSLLNGSSGVRGTAVGRGLQFVRGSASVVSSGKTDYPVRISRAPTSSTLIGAERIDATTIGKEHVITIVSESQEAVYRIKKGEDGESIVANLQECLSGHGLDIGVYKTCDDYLLLKHNQPGNKTVFKGLSQKTGIISKTPGKYKFAVPGENVSGTIASEPAYGRGGFLIGKEGNLRTDGLVLHYSGNMVDPQVSVGTVRVEQNGVVVPLNQTGSQAERLSLPQIAPDTLSVGVSNRSGCISLNTIRVNSQEEKDDALMLIQYAMSELESLIAEIRKKEDYYIALAIGLLQSIIQPKPADMDIFSCSKEKASEMACRLKAAITPDMMQPILHR